MTHALRKSCLGRETLPRTSPSSLTAAKPFLVRQCFGQNDKGQLGQGDTFTRGEYPGELGNNLTAIDFGDSLPRSISAGCEHVCALLDDGSIKCFGDNAYGQLGQVRGESTGDSSDAMESRDCPPQIDSAFSLVVRG